MAITISDHVTQLHLFVDKDDHYITMNIIAKPCYLNWDCVMETFYIQEFPPWFFCFYKDYILWSNISIPLLTIISFLMVTRKMVISAKACCFNWDYCAWHIENVQDDWLFLKMIDYHNCHNQNCVSYGMIIWTDAVVFYIILHVIDR